MRRERPPFPPGPALADAQRLMKVHAAVQRNEDLSARLGSLAGPERPLVSVVTAVLNRGATLARCLESVRTQDYSPIEHIVVDGGSTDGTLEIIRANAGSMTAWLSEPDGGVSEAFNRGIGLARGEIVGLLNADDWYEPDAIGEVVRALGTDPGAGVACGRLRFVRGDVPDVEFPSQPERLGVDMTVNHPTLFARRAVYERVGLYRTDLRLAMDYDWVLRARRKGVRFRSLDRVLANMAWEGASDLQWRRTLVEVARVVHGHYPRSLWWHARLLLKLTKATSARALDAAGLQALTRFYRSHISPFRRVYPKD